jgi:hypothetical protein
VTPPPRFLLLAAAAAVSVAALGAGAILLVRGGSGHGSAPEAAAAARPEARAGFQVVDERSVVVGAGATTHVQLTFEGAAAATVLVESDSVGILTARFGGARLAKSDLAGRPVLVRNLRHPSAGALVLRNRSAEPVQTRIVTAVATARVLTVTTPDEPVAPGSAVTIVVRLSRASQRETPVVDVRDDTARRFVVTSARPEPAGPGRWTLTFTPQRAGDYTAFARIGGPRPRAADSFFWVTATPPASKPPGSGDSTRVE